MTGAADDGGEDGPRGVVSGEPGLAHAGAIVHHQSSNFVVAHVDVFVCGGNVVLKLCPRGRYGFLDELRVTELSAGAGGFILPVSKSFSEFLAIPCEGFSKYGERPSSNMVRGAKQEAEREGEREPVEEREREREKLAEREREREREREGGRSYKAGREQTTRERALERERERQFPRSGSGRRSQTPAQFPVPPRSSPWASQRPSWAGGGGQRWKEDPMSPCGKLFHAAACRLVA